jgi:DNA-binding GntR family transcriptional regulator
MTLQRTEPNWAADGEGRGYDALDQDNDYRAPAYLDAPHHDSVHHQDGAARQSGREPADPILTGRIAASVALHQPGWLLPRPSVLARRYQATTGQVTAAIDELAARHLIRLRSDGTACRISPADYMLELESQHGLSARVEPLHGQLSCRSKSVAWHAVRRDIESALGVAPGEPVCILQMLWTLSGQPAAATTTYLAGPAAEKILAEIEVADLEALRTILPMPPADGATSDGDAEFHNPALVPHALHIAVQQPPPWAAMALRLSACDSAISITVNYAGLAEGSAAAFAVAVLRPSEFRVIVDSVVTPAQAAGFARCQHLRNRNPANNG